MTLFILSGKRTFFEVVFVLLSGRPPAKRHGSYRYYEVATNLQLLILHLYIHPSAALDYYKVVIDNIDHASIRYYACANISRMLSASSVCEREWAIG